MTYTVTIHHRDSTTDLQTTDDPALHSTALTCPGIDCIHCQTP